MAEVTPNYFSKYTLEASFVPSPLSRSLQAGSSQYYFCTLTLRLVRDKHWGLQCNNEYEFNQVNRGLSDLSIHFVDINLGCEAPPDDEALKFDDIGFLDCDTIGQ